MKNENFGILVIFQSFCVRINICKGFSWVAFHRVYKAVFSAVPIYLPLSLCKRNCREFSKCVEFLGI